MMPKICHEEVTDKHLSVSKGTLVLVEGSEIEKSDKPDLFGMKMVYLKSRADRRGNRNIFIYGCTFNQRGELQEIYPLDGTLISEGEAAPLIEVGNEYREAHGIP